MKTKWKAHIKSKDALESFEHCWVNSKLIRDRMSALLDELLEEAEKDRVDTSNYSLPNWSLHQADCNAQVRTINKIKDLLKD